MGQPPLKSVEDKVRVVLAVLRGEISIAAAARREGTSGVSISKWRDLFLAGGQQAGEIEELNRALGEAHMELRLWKKGGSLHSTSTPSRRNGPRPT